MRRRRGRSSLQGSVYVSCGSPYQQPTLQYINARGETGALIQVLTNETDAGRRVFAIEQSAGGTAWGKTRRRDRLTRAGLLSVSLSVQAGFGDQMRLQAALRRPASLRSSCSDCSFSAALMRFALTVTTATWVGVATLALAVGDWAWASSI